eukprot:1081543-Prorocentrum_minimum.AAC.1
MDAGTVVTSIKPLGGAVRQVRPATSTLCAHNINMNGAVLVLDMDASTVVTSIKPLGGPVRQVRPVTSTPCAHNISPPIPLPHRRPSSPPSKAARGGRAPGEARTVNTPYQQHPPLTIHLRPTRTLVRHPRQQGLSGVSEARRTGEVLPGGQVPSGGGGEGGEGV